MWVSFLREAAFFVVWMANGPIVLDVRPFGQSEIGVYVKEFLVTVVMEVYSSAR